MRALNRFGGPQLVLRSARTRSTWTVVDQLVSSVSNLVLGTLVARSATTEEYGAFAVGFACTAVAIGLGRGLASEPFLARFSGAGHDRWRGGAASATSFALGFALLSSMVLGLAATAASGDLRSVLIAFAVVVPAVLLQDTLRYVLIGAGGPQLAAVSDSVLLVALCTVVAIPGPWVWTPPTLVLAWGASALLAYLPAIAVVRTRPSFVGARRWWRDSGHLGTRFALEFLMLSGATQLVLFAAAITAGFDAAAALRGGNVLLGPVAILTAGVAAATLAEGRRLIEVGDERFPAFVVAVAGALAVLTAAWGLACLAIPEAVGTFLLGETWVVARPIMPLLGVVAGATHAAAGLMAGLRALHAASASLRATAPISLLLATGGVAGGAVGGAAGALVGMLPAAWLGLALYARSFLRAARRRS